MKKVFSVILALLVCACMITACAPSKPANDVPVQKRNAEAQSNTDPLVPTGYPDGEIQRPYLYCNGTLYVYCAEVQTDLPQDAELIGEVRSVDNLHLPSEEFAASRLDVGDKVYKTEHLGGLIVEENDRFARFEVCTQPQQ